MNVTEYLLTQMASECNEVAHRIAKAQQFGLNETEPGKDKNNADRIVQEFSDLLGVFQMLCEKGILFMDNDQLLLDIEAKIKKVERFMEYAKSLGTLKGAE